MAYRGILEKHGVPLERVKVILQSRGNDLFKKVLRRTRSGIEQLKAVNPDYLHETFQQTNALFLSTENQGLFSLTTPYLYDTRVEDSYFGGIWWKDYGSINQRDLEHCPLVRLKKNPVINLYETGGECCVQQLTVGCCASSTMPPITLPSMPGVTMSSSVKRSLVALSPPMY